MPPIEDAEVDLPCADVQETAAFFGRELGFRLHTIFPADDPSIAVVTGHGLRLRLVRGMEGDPGRLRLLGDEARAPLIAPNGTRIEFAPLDPWPDVPAPRASVVFTPPPAEADWHVGRAGMQYRDLIPDRWGGHVIASHIRIPTGGPVPDYVHFHKIRFQAIHCVAGWVRLVYEDQGPPFVMRAGDCVLQPPTIRHQVLECSDGFEVVELGCPAEHPTHPDPDLSLPNGTTDPDRDFHGQRFRFHETEKTPWSDSGVQGLAHQDFGMRAATGGIVTFRMTRATTAVESDLPETNKARFLFMLAGQGAVAVDGVSQDMAQGSSLAVPPGQGSRLRCDARTSFLEVLF
jgi:quercetin dioxygenase-like cupin family protein